MEKLRRGKFYRTEKGVIVQIANVQRKDNYVFVWEVYTPNGRSFDLDFAENNWKPVGLDCKNRTKRIKAIHPYCLYRAAKGSEETWELSYKIKWIRNYN